MQIGDIFTQEDFLKHSIWATAHKAMIKDLKDGKYQLVSTSETRDPTYEETKKARQSLYAFCVDNLTAHIQRLRDEEQTPEVVAEIAALVEERKAKVEEIKQIYPYPVELIEKIEELPVVEEVVVSKMENVEESEEVIEDGLQREETEVEETSEPVIELYSMEI